MMEASCSRYLDETFRLGHAVVRIYQERTDNKTTHTVQIAINERSFDYSPEYDFDELKDVAAALRAAITIIDHLKGRVDIIGLANRLRDIPPLKHV